MLALEQRLFMLEHEICMDIGQKMQQLFERLERLECQSQLRIMMLEQRSELLARVLVKLTKRKN